MGSKIIITTQEFDVLSRDLKEIIHKMFAIDEYEFTDIFALGGESLTPRQRIYLQGGFEKSLERVASREEAYGIAGKIYDYLDICAAGFLSLRNTIDIDPKMLSTVLENALNYLMNLDHTCAARGDMFDIRYEDSDKE